MGHPRGMELHELARHGVVSTADATSLGIDPSGLRRMVRSGEAKRLIRGWYAVCPPGAERPPWEGRDQFETARLSHQLVTAALLRAFGGRAVASHQSALVLHGVPLWRSDLGTVHLCRSATHNSRHRAGAVIHPVLEVPPVTAPGGLETVPVAHAVVQVGMRAPAPGLAPLPLESLVAADAALHAELITEDDVKAAVEAHTGQSGIPGVRLLLKHADGRHESVGETRLAHTMRVLGYRFTPQVPVEAGGRCWRVDFALDDDPVIVEFDGITKYSGGLENPTPEKLRRAFAAEKWREDRLRDKGNEVTRFVWPEIDNLRLVERRLDQAVARSRLRRGA